METKKDCHKCENCLVFFMKTNLEAFKEKITIWNTHGDITCYKFFIAKKLNIFAFILILVGRK